MEPRLSLTQSQKMALSPQMREYLRLLHLPIADLRTAVEETLAENPILEEAARPSSTDSIEALTERKAESSQETDDRLSTDWGESESFPIKMPFDLSRKRPKEAQRLKGFEETLITKPESLFDFLTWQLHFLNLDEKQKVIAEEIVGNIDQDGYLQATPEEIASTCRCPTETVLDVLKTVQELDPPGIAARNLAEALRIQLERKGADAVLPKEIVLHHLELVAKKDWKMLSRIFNVSELQIQKAVNMISHLEPKPGRTFYAEEQNAVTPDATISIKEGTKDGLEIELHNEIIPEIRINPEYRQMLRSNDIDAKTKEYLKNKLALGLGFLKALELRGSTLRAITEEIVRAQPLFFTRGFAHLRPLRLKDISEKLGLHESTVSRAIHGKYMVTPQGTIPYKSFFSARVETENGEGESQKSIMERIRALAEKEDPKKPLSDQSIVKLLKAEGIQIARRTVAKYRDLLKILPTHLRRQR